MSRTDLHLTSTRSEADAGQVRMQAGADSAYPRARPTHSPERTLAETAASTDVGSGASACFRR